MVMSGGTSSIMVWGEEMLEIVICLYGWEERGVSHIEPKRVAPPPMLLSATRAFRASRCQVWTLVRRRCHGGGVGGGAVGVVGRKENGNERLRYSLVHREKVLT